MDKEIKIIFALLVFLGLSNFAFAETIVLKSGKTVEGKIIEKTDEHIKMDVYGVVITYYKDEIASLKENENNNIPISMPDPGKEDNGYSNSDFGVKISAPSGWYLKDISQALQAQQPQIKLFGVILSKERYDGNEENLPELNIQFLGLKMPVITPEMKTEVFVSSAMSEMKNNPSIKLIKDAEKIQINGREWISFDYIEEDSIKGVVYFYTDTAKGVSYTCQVTSKKEEFDSYAGDFNKVLGSIEF